MTEKIMISYDSDESFTVSTASGEHIITANHDDDGWSGMERIRFVVQRLAELGKMDIEYGGDACV